VPSKRIKVTQVKAGNVITFLRHDLIVTKSSPFSPSGEVWPNEWWLETIEVDQDAPSPHRFYRDETVLLELGVVKYVTEPDPTPATLF
jgi:hypothetical protein